jgi:hypothetical protein
VAPDDVFIFQCTTDVAQSVNTKVILSGGVQAKNVVTERWQCEDSAGASMREYYLVFYGRYYRDWRLREWCYLCSDCRCTPEGDGYVGCWHVC